MVTGGITLENMEEYLEAGSAAVGVGSNLADPRKLHSEEDFKELREKAKSFTERLAPLN